MHENSILSLLLALLRKEQAEMDFSLKKMYTIYGFIRKRRGKNKK